MVEFFNRYIHPSSPQRAKLALHFVAQAKSDVSTRQISELVAALDLDDDRAALAATDLQARLSAAHHDEAKEMEKLEQYLLHDLKVTESKIDAAVEAWKKLHDQDAGPNGVVKDAPLPSSNGSTPIIIDDVRDYKASLAVSAGARPVKDLSEYEDLGSKL
jgi:insulysin